MTEGGTPGARQRPTEARLYGLIGVMLLFWSANFVVGKIALREFPPLLLSGLRTALAALFILPVFFWSRRLRLPTGSLRRDLTAVVCAGLIGVALNQVFFVFGLSHTSVAHSAIVIGLTPILVLLMAAFAAQEHLSGRKIIGMGIALAGVIALSLAPGKSGGASLVGDMFIFLASLTFAWFTVYGKRVTVRHGAVVVTTVAYLGAAVALAPLTIALAARHGLGHVSLTGWASLVYMALFPSMVCYLIYSYALQHIPASRVSAFSYLQPLLATLIAIPALGERLGGGLIAGGVLVFAGVWITERT